MHVHVHCVWCVRMPYFAMVCLFVCMHVRSKIDQNVSVYCGAVIHDCRVVASSTVHCVVEL